MLNGQKRLVMNSKKHPFHFYALELFKELGTKDVHIALSTYEITMVLRANSRKHDKFITSEYHNSAVLCLVTQSCPTLCHPMGCSPPGSFVHGDSPGKNTGVGCYALLQGIFPTQGSNPGLLHCRQILYCLSHQGSPYLLTVS